MIHYHPSSPREAFWEGERLRVIPVNCEGVMGAGLALAAKQKHPELLGLLKRMEIKPGETLLVQKTNIIFMATKDKWRNRSEDVWVLNGLKALRKLLDRHPYPCALPAVGCGLGGLSWDDVVKPMIEEVFADFEGELHVFLPT